MTAATDSLPAVQRRAERLPVAALVVMALTGFIVTMTETLPAGLLPQLAAGLGVDEAAAGQLVGIYAVGTTIAVVPAMALTRGFNRKPLLIIGLIGFITANTLTALVPVYAVTLVVRFIAGAFAGLLWGMLATYARGISPAALSGKAISIALTGTPLALAFGTPLGTLLGSALGWQLAFLAMSALTVLVLVLALLVVPGLAGNRSTERASVLGVLRIPGVLTILFVVFTWIFAQYVLYTYIVPFMSATGLELRSDVALLVFGVASLVGIWVTAHLVDRMLRRVAIYGASLMVIAGIALALVGANVPAAIAAIVLWGLAFGGAASQTQTAMGHAAGTDADMGIAYLSAMFNLAIFGAATVGGPIVANGHAGALAWIMTGVALVVLIAIVSGKKAAFPARK